MVIGKGEIETMDDERYGEYMKGRIVRVGKDTSIGRVPATQRIMKFDIDQERRLNIGEFIQVGERHFVYLHRGILQELDITWDQRNLLDGEGCIDISRGKFQKIRL